MGGGRGPWQGGLGWEGKAAAAPHHAPQMPPSHSQQAAPFIVHCYWQQSCQNLSLGILNLPTPQQQGPWGHCSSLCQHLPPFSPQPTTPPGPCICPALLLPPGHPSGFCRLLGCPLLSSVHTGSLRKFPGARRDTDTECLGAFQQGPPPKYELPASPTPGLPISGSPVFPGWKTEHPEAPLTLLS